MAPSAEMGNPSFISGDQLIPHLAHLRDQLTPTSKDEVCGLPALALQLDFLPYALGAACCAVSELLYAQSRVTAEVLGGVRRDSTFYVLSPEHRDCIAFRIDSFLDAARRAQNGLVPYIGRSLGQSLPASMDDVAKKLQTGALQLPADIGDTLQTYWRTSGQRLKYYRDLSQHHGLVASDARVFFRRTGVPAIFLLLPNNPEDKHPNALRFEKPAVHAATYCKQAFLELLGCVYSATKPLFDKGHAKVIRHFLRTSPRINNDEPEGAPLLSTDDFRREVVASVHGLETTGRLP